MDMDKRYAEISNPNIIIPADNCSDLFFRLFNSLNDGICVFEVRGKKIRALYLNDRYFEIIGFTKEQYLPYYDNVTVTVFKEDEERILEKAKKCLETGKDFICEARGYRYDGSINQLCIKAKCVDFIKSDYPVFLASISDISALKKTEQLLSIKTERSRILEETTGAFLIEYDCINDVMVFSRGKDLDDVIITSYSSYLRRDCPIYDDDLLYYCNALFKVCRKKDREVVDVRSFDRKRNEYSVCRIILSSITDDYDRVIRVVGRIEIVDEKSGITARLAEDRKCNSVAGLPDSLTALGLIKERLECCGKHCFMAVADIDNFTRFNELYGKETADNAIMLAAELIKDVFGEQAIIFRYVGDEFVIFIEDISESTLYDMVDKLRAACRTAMLTAEGGTCSAEISLSVGAAWTSCDKKVSVKDFFITADKALIKAKTDGKNRMYVEKIIY